MTYHRPPRRLRVDKRPGNYYVSVVDGQRVGLLLGPFKRHRQALRFVRAARAAACNADPKAWFYSYGTVRVVTDKPRTGVLNAAVGVRPYRKSA